VYTSVALSSSRVANHAAATNGYYGDTTGARIQRYLQYAGLTSSDWTLATGVALVNTYPQAGKTIAQACRDMAATDGQGAVIYVTGDGKVTFADRTSRKGTAALTFDAMRDLDSSIWGPDFSDDNLVNSVSVDRSSTSATQTTQTFTDAASQTVYGSF